MILTDGLVTPETDLINVSPERQFIGARSVETDLHSVQERLRSVEIDRKSGMENEGIERDLKNTEAGLNSSSIENSLIDMDELPMDQRLQMCRRAIQVVSEMGVKFSDDKPTGPSKFFVWSGEQRSDDINATTLEIDRDLRHNIVQAFPCSTIPDTYVFVQKEGYEEDEDDYYYDDDDDDEDEQPTMWVMLREGGKRPMYQILGFLLRPMVNIKEGTVNS